MNGQDDGGRVFLPLSRWIAARRAPWPGIGLAMLLLVALPALSACAGGTPAPLGAIPLPPSDSIEIPEDVLPFDRAAILDSLQASAQAGTVDVRMYVVPVDTGFQQLEAYYGSFLGVGWEVQETAALATAQAQGGEAVLWSNQQTGEILSLQYMPAPAYQGNLLIILYASKEQAQTPAGGARAPA